MNRPESEDRLKDAVRRLAAGVDGSSFHGELSEKCAAKTRRRRRGRHIRAWAVGMAVVALLVAGGFGVNALVERMGQDKGIVVITDETMSPGGPGNGGPPPVGTQGTTLTGAKAELWDEIQRIREGVKAGELIFGWTATEAAGGDLPSDPMAMLDSLEKSLLRPDVTLYLRDSAGDGAALRDEIAAMPGVTRLEYVSKDEALQKLKEDFADNPEVLSGLVGNPLPASLEIWLSDYTQAASLAAELRSRPDVDEARAPTMDYAQWVARLQSLTREGSGDGERVLLANPYPFPTISSGITGEQPSTWAEDLGRAVLDFYPDKDWKVFRAVEMEGGVVRLTIAPASGKAAPGSWPTDVSRLSISIRREESGRISQDTDSGQHHDFETAYGHGLILPRYSDGEKSSIVSWFLRPDKLMIQVGVSQPSAPDVSADLGLDEQGVQGLLAYIASIIEMAEGNSVQETATYGVAPSSEVPPLSSTATIMGVGPILSWGEEAVLDGRKIKVEQPVEAPDKPAELLPDETAIYSLITITNTGNEPLTCAAAEFFLMGKSTGSSGGIGGLEKTLAGHEVLTIVTLQPGESVKAAVGFCLSQGNHPVKMLLGTRSSTGEMVVSPDVV